MSVANNYSEEKRRGERTKRENERTDGETERKRRREKRKRSDRGVGRQSVISSVIDHRANVMGLAGVSGLPTEYRPPIGSRQVWENLPRVFNACRARWFIAMTLFFFFSPFFLFSLFSTRPTTRRYLRISTIFKRASRLLFRKAETKGRYFVCLKFSIAECRNCTDLLIFEKNAGWDRFVEIIFCFKRSCRYASINGRDKNWNLIEWKDIKVNRDGKFKFLAWRDFNYGSSVSLSLSLSLALLFLVDRGRWRASMRHDTLRRRCIRSM